MKPNNPLRKLFTCIPAVLWIVLVTSAAVYASGGEGESGHEGKKLIDFIWRVVNFSALAFVLYKLLGKNMKTFFAGRREEIAASVEEARVAREEAERKFKEYDEKLTAATGEITGISEMIRAQGLEEKERLIADAGKIAEKMKEDAEVRMEQDLKKAGNRLRMEASELSVQMAEDILKRNVTEKDHDKMVTEYIDRMVKGN
jgi:F-type H+-transporting ATPase subunit b